MKKIRKIRILDLWFPILFRTTLTTVLHYRADCDKWKSRKSLIIRNTVPTYIPAGTVLKLLRTISVLSTISDRYGVDCQNVYLNQESLSAECS